MGESTHTTIRRDGIEGRGCRACHAHSVPSRTPTRQPKGPAWRPLAVGSPSTSRVEPASTAPIRRGAEDDVGGRERVDRRVASTRRTAERRPKYPGFDDECYRATLWVNGWPFLGTEVWAPDY